MNFLESDFYVTKPVLAIHVPFGTHEPVHNNRPSHGVVFFAGGEHHYVFEKKKKITCKKGDFIYLPQNSSYIVTADGYAEKSAKNVFAINFLISLEEQFEPFKIVLKNPAKIQQFFESAEKNWVKKSIGYTDAVFSDLYKILQLLKKEYNSSYYGSKYKTLIFPAVNYISNNYLKEKITAEKLACMCGISVSYLRRLFNSCYGVSPIEYIINLRLQYAKELIVSGGFSVTAAAENSGFNDISYFSRAFKKNFGISPSKIIENELNKTL